MARHGPNCASRRLRAIALAGAACSLAAGLLASGSAAERAQPAAKAPSPIAITIESASQQRITTRERLKIEIDSQTAPGKLEIRAKTRDANGRAFITQVRRIKVRSADPRTVSLPLTAAGVERVKRCVAQVIKVRAIGPMGDGRTGRGRARADLVLDRPPCDGGGGNSNRDYAVAPGGERTHTNGTPREFAAAGTGSEQVMVALYRCEDVSEVGEELSFVAADGKATQNPTGAGITRLNGDPVPGSPAIAGPVAAEGGQVSFTISGSDGCAAPIVFADLNGDGALNIDANGVPTEPYGGGGETTFEPQGVTFANADRCDPTDPSVCLHPFPNDHFTVADPTTDTGRRIDLSTDSMPKNRFGVPIDPTDQNRADGFSPGSMLITKVPGLDTPQAFQNTGSVPITDFDRYADADAPVVVIDAATGERHPIFTELDANPSDPADVTLIVRPTVNFEEGHRYVVALRDLRDTQNQLIPAGRAFQLYRDPIVTSDPVVEERRADFERIFDELEGAGIGRDELYLAWDFTIASESSLTERMLSIRDRAFASLGDTNLADLQVQGQAPTSFVTGTTNYGPCGNDGCAEDPITGEATEDDRIARKVEGAVVVPCFLDEAGCPPGSRFSLGADGLPQQNPVPHTAQFECLIPRSAVDAGLRPARPSLYGHGLLGSFGEVEAGNVKSMANEHDFMFCATDWAGFATTDAGTVLANLQDLSNFPRLIDRMQQGFLNQLFLGRAMIHPQGFGSHPAFQLNGQSVIDDTRLFYDGNSQGGIMGGGLTAVAPDFERAVLGVPAMNYSTLLRRSSDFAPYAEGNFNDPPGDTDAGLYDNYPNELERPLILALIQMLWDRGEANGYAHHMTSDPLPNTPPHEVLMHVAFGDHQVSNLAADVEARTIGAYTNAPALDPGRIPAGDPLWSIPAIPSYPFGGSAIIYFDSGPPREGDQGVVNPPLTNTPPDAPEYGRDPHSDPRSNAFARQQKSAFLQPAGGVINVCDDHPCYTHGWTGP
ncbi:MAG: hypothetical protein ACR2G3_02110 [Solirubrobacterales bacterium]